MFKNNKKKREKLRFEKARFGEAARETPERPVSAEQE